MQASNQTTQQVSYMMRPNRIDLRISGLNFPKNSSVNFYQRTAFTRQNWIMCGVTEEVSGKEDPVFKQSIIIQYFFSAKQEICAEVIDSSNNTTAGKIYFNLANLLTTPNQVLSVTLQKEGPAYSKQISFLVMKAENFTDYLDEFKIKLAGSLVKSGIFTLRTFLSLWKHDPKANKYIQMARSNVSAGDTPIWNPIKIKLVDLCEKDDRRKCKLAVHKLSKSEEDKVLGCLDFTIEEIFSKNIKKFDLMVPGSQQASDSSSIRKSIGTIFVDDKELIRVPQFIDYVFGGLEICTSIGIDFSKKGGSYMDPGSLHYSIGEAESLCEATVKHFAEVLAPYNPSKEISYYGFGAAVHDMAVEENYDTYSSCFLLTGESKSITFSNIKLFQESYRKTTRKVEPHQIRFITPVVETIASNLKKDQFYVSKARYYTIILLIEEAIEDVQELIDFMVILSDQIAVTLVLVGMGKGSYSTLEGFHVFSGSKTPFYDTKGNILENNAIMFLSMSESRGNPVELVKEVLKFIPDRVHLSMTKNSLSPEQLGLAFENIPKVEQLKESSKDTKTLDDYDSLPLQWK